MNKRKIVILAIVLAVFFPSANRLSAIIAAVRDDGQAMIILNIPVEIPIGDESVELLPGDAVTTVVEQSPLRPGPKRPEWSR